MTVDTLTITLSIRFGSFEFVPHPPAHRSVYADLYGGMCLTFGSMNFHVNK